MNEYLIPSIEQIKSLYNEVIPLLEKLKTKADVIEFGKKHKVTMEINYDLAELFDESESIDVIRCESWGNLSYIYVYTKQNKPHFDVWCDFMEYDFIDGAYVVAYDYADGDDIYVFSYDYDEFVKESEELIKSYINKNDGRYSYSLIKKANKPLLMF